MKCSITVIQCKFSNLLLGVNVPYQITLALQGAPRLNVNHLILKFRIFKESMFFLFYFYCHFQMQFGLASIKHCH